MTEVIRKLKEKNLTAPFTAEDLEFLTETITMEQDKEEEAVNIAAEWL